MLGSDQWFVLLNGSRFKGPMPRHEADAFAERWQRGLCKHKDHRIHLEVKRATSAIHESDERYATAKRGERQVTHYYLETGE